MLSQAHETLNHQLPKLIEPLGLWATHDIHILTGEFEGYCFEVHIARGVRKHETEVNMHYMAFGVQKNVPIVSILNL